MREGCEKCIHYHAKTSEFPCKECNRLFYGMETDHFTENVIDDRPAEDPDPVDEDIKGCEGCNNFHTAGTQFPCRECKRFNDKKTTDHYYDGPVDHPAEDPVNHPKHYADTCSLECIDVMLIAFGKDAVINFCMCNAFKYMWRFRNKNGQEDLQKAKWYLNKAEELGPDDYTHDQILCLCATLGRLNRGKEND